MNFIEIHIAKRKLCQPLTLTRLRFRFQEQTLYGPVEQETSLRQGMQLLIAFYKSFEKIIRAGFQRACLGLRHTSIFTSPLMLSNSISQKDDTGLFSAGKIGVRENINHHVSSQRCVQPFLADPRNTLISSGYQS